MRIPSGTTDQYIYFVAVDATDFSTRETGLSSFTVYRSRNNGTATAMTTPTIAEKDATNMPGVYTLLLDEDMTIDSGDDSQEMAFHITHAGMAPVTRTIELYRPKITVGNTLGVAADGDISGNVDGAVASVTGNVGGIAGTIQTLDALDTAQDTQHSTTQSAIGALNNISAADVNAQADTALADFFTSTAALVDLIWDEPTSGHSTAGTTGKALTDAGSAGDPWSTDVSLGGYTGTQAGKIIQDILTDTAVIGAAGAGLTAIPWNASWDAEVQSEVDDAIVARNLHYLLGTALPTSWAVDIASGSALDYMARDGTAAYDRTTDSLQAVRDWIGNGSNLTEAGGTGDHLTAIPSVVTVTGNVDGNVGGNVVGSVGSVTGGINTGAGVITTLDALDTAQDTQHSTTQSAISGLNNISTSDVLTQASAALQAIGLDHLVSAAVIGTDIADNSIVARLVSSSATADWDSYDNTTDSLQAVRDWIGNGSNLTEAGGTGDHLTGILLGNQTFNLTGNISGSVGSVTGGINTGSGVITTLDALDTAQDAQHATTQAAVAGLNDLSTADILAQVNAALDTAISELSGDPGATPTLRTAVMLPFMALRNKLDVETSGSPDVLQIHNNAGTVILTKTLTDDGSDYSESKVA